MQTGMMPAKLTHTLINIGLSQPPFRFSPPRGVSGDFEPTILIRDPFC
jgi:hypothetical protein